MRLALEARTSVHVLNCHWREEEQCRKYNKTGAQQRRRATRLKSNEAEERQGLIVGDTIGGPTSVFESNASRSGLLLNRLKTQQSNRI
jgi:hypothetical protein